LQNRQLLAGIVADNADFPADLRPVGVERQRTGLDEPQPARLVAINAEVVDRIPVDGIQLHLLAIEKSGLGGHGARRHDVAIREDESALGIHDEPGSLRRGIPLGIEGARRVDLDRNDTFCDAFERRGPIGALARHCRRGPRLRHGADSGRRRRADRDNSAAQQQRSQARFAHSHSDPHARRVPKASWKRCSNSSGLKR
jgi:hypothetical protein